MRFPCMYSSSRLVSHERQFLDDVSIVGRHLGDSLVDVV